MSGPRNATTTSRGRVYTWAGQSFWSVTTVLGGGLPKPALLPWGIKATATAAVAEAERVAAMVRAAGDDPCPCAMRCHDEKERCSASCEALVSVIGWLKGAPYRQRERAADLGSLVHARIEALILGQPQPPAPPVAAGFLAAFDAFLADWSPEFLAAEMTVYSRSAAYAGTLDWIARIPGLGVVLGDTKTGRSVYADAALQLTAYRRAEFAGMPDGTEAPMPETDLAAVLHLRPDGTYSLLPARTDDDVWQTFLYVAQVFRWAESIAKSALGEPFVPAVAMEGVA